MIKYIIDRIEGEYAVCIDELEEAHDVKLSKFDFPVKEGLFLFYNEKEDSFFVDTDSSDKQKSENSKRLNRLFNRKN